MEFILKQLKAGYSYATSENKLLWLISSASIVTKSDFVKTESPELNILFACRIRAVSIALLIVGLIGV